jgi:hypothetical protein
VLMSYVIWSEVADNRVTSGFAVSPDEVERSKE